jgi:hypothetical protein
MAWMKEKLISEIFVSNQDRFSSAFVANSAARAAAGEWYLHRSLHS